MLFTLEIYKQDKRTKTGRRLVGKYDYDRPDRAALERDIAALFPLTGWAGYQFNIEETMVTRINAMTGLEFQERYDEPFTSSPRSESFWCS